MIEITGTPEELREYGVFSQEYEKFCKYVYEPLRSGGRAFLTKEQIEMRGRECADRAKEEFKTFRPKIEYFIEHTSPDFRKQNEVMITMRNVKRCLDSFGLE